MDTVTQFVIGAAAGQLVGGRALGRTAEAIVTRLARSVAVVKPAGYVSPVRQPGAPS